MESKWSTEQDCACGGNSNKLPGKKLSFDCETSRSSSRGVEVANFFLSSVQKPGSFDSRWQKEQNISKGLNSELSKRITNEQNIKLKQQPNIPKTSQVSNCEKKPVGDLLNFIAGGTAGAVSTCVTLPLELLKTRQQSSGPLEVLKNDPGSSRQILRPPPLKNSTSRNLISSMFRNSARNAHSTGVTLTGNSLQPLIFQYWKCIVRTEGPQALFKGLAPSLIAIVPTRGTYFCMYKKSKEILQKNGIKSDSSLNHILSAFTGSLCATTLSSPIWLLKTKQQLHRRLNNTSLGLIECGKKVWSTEGWKGFYRGVGASYCLMFENVLYFWMYENLRSKYLCRPEAGGINCDVKKSSELFGIIPLISAGCKVTSSVMSYPAEVIRTRLREESKQKKYTGVLQTFKKVYGHEGVRGLYGGLTVHLVRQVPNMAIVMVVYEGIIRFAS